MVIACEVSNMASAAAAAATSAANNGTNDNARGGGGGGEGGGGGGNVTLLVNGEPAVPSLPASPPQTLPLSPPSPSASTTAVPSDAGPCTVAAAVQKLKEEEKKVQLVSSTLRYNPTNEN